MVPHLGRRGCDDDPRRRCEWLAHQRENHDTHGNGRAVALQQPRDVAPQLGRSPNWFMSDPPNGEGMGQFTLHTYCKTPEVKKNYADFWLDGEKEAYIVRHNYGSNNFFLPEDAIKMERVIVDEATAERGYVVNTSQVDYEFGFALKNLATGEWLYEIGKGSESMVYNEHCVQQFGAYWNRIRTSQPDPSNVEYVLGTCRKKCARLPGKLDADAVRPGRHTQRARRVDHRQIRRRARLFTLLSAVMGSWIRSAASRDTSSTRLRTRRATSSHTSTRTAPASGGAPARRTC